MVDLTKYVVAQIYPVLVWGTLMGLAVHAGLSFQLLHSTVDSEPVSVINDLSSRVPITVRVPEKASSRSAALP